MLFVLICGVISFFFLVNLKWCINRIREICNNSIGSTKFIQLLLIGLLSSLFMFIFLYYLTNEGSNNNYFYNLNYTIKCIFKLITVIAQFNLNLNFPLINYLLIMTLLIDKLIWVAYIVNKVQNINSSPQSL